MTFTLRDLDNPVIKKGLTAQLARRRGGGPAGAVGVVGRRVGGFVVAGGWGGVGGWAVAGVGGRAAGGWGGGGGGRGARRRCAVWAWVGRRRGGRGGAARARAAGAGRGGWRGGVWRGGRPRALVGRGPRRV